MPSRRNVLRAVGPALGVGLAGCSASRTTTGVVARKQIRVSVPREVGGPVDVTLALLTFEPGGLVTGKYANIVTEVVKGASIAVSDGVHDRLSQRFPDVHYYANIESNSGAEPVNGRLSRDEFNSLTVGGTATAGFTMKSVDEAYSVGHLEIHDTAPRERSPAEIRVNQYDWDKRIDGIRDNA